MPSRKISLQSARRIAIAAQRLDRPRPEGPINVGHIRRAIDQIGLLQLDYVNVLVPAHLMVLFTRLGAYDFDCFQRAVYRGKRFTEQWAHEASIVPQDLWPALAHRRKAFKPWPRCPILKMRNRRAYMATVLDIVTKEAPVTARDLPESGGTRRRKPGEWHRTMRRWALELHFAHGNIVVADRLPSFQRSFDIPERRIAKAFLDRELSEHEGQRELLLRAARGLGIFTLQDVADYYRMSPRDAAPRVSELEEEGAFVPVEVEGWDKSAWLLRGQRTPRSFGTSRLLSPFDPLVWFRPRTERLFGFHYRIEIYVPAAKRKWGYYVLPFLMDDKIVARVDLKADRKARSLNVLASHVETGVDNIEVSTQLHAELGNLADWLDLESINVSRKGNLARHLSAANRCTRS